MTVGVEGIGSECGNAQALGVGRHGIGVRGVWDRFPASAGGWGIGWTWVLGPSPCFPVDMEP